MAETSLGRASLSVTADLSGFTTALDSASQKTNQLTTTNDAMADAANKVTTATEQQTKSLEDLQKAAVQGAINLATHKQQILSAKLATDALVMQSESALFLAYNERKLALDQAVLNTSQKEFQFHLLESGKGMQSLAKGMEIQSQKQKTLELSTKKLVTEMMGMDRENISQIAIQKTLSSEMDLATRKMDLQARQMNLESGATRKLYEEMAALEEQEKALAAQEEILRAQFQKTQAVQENISPPVIEKPKDLVNESILAAGMKQDQLASKLATDALVQQDGATLILMQDQKKLEAEQAKLVTSNKALENSLLKNDQAFRNNTFEIQKNIQKQQLYELNQKNLLARMSAVDQESVKMTAIQKRLTTETDIAAKKMDLQARQMLIESGAAVKLAKELAELEDMEQSIIAAETTIQNQFRKTTKEMETAAKATSEVVSNQKIETPKQPKVQKVSLGIKDYIGIGAAVTAFNKITDMVTGAISAVVKFGASVVDAGAKFQQVDIRLQALTGSKTLAKGLQDIMKSGPSASFEALAESATRLSALKFDAKSVEILTRQFNQLGIALGEPEKIMALIVDKIGDMAADGQATFPALSKLAEVGIPVWDALSARLTRTTGNLVTVAQAQEMVKDGLVQVGEASAAIGEAAGMGNIQELMKKNANSFYGVWSTVANNLQVLFQKVGGFFVDGFSLVSLSDGIQKLFDSIGKKMDELRPFFTKIGVFISSVMGIAQDAITDFFDAWINKQHEFDLESVLKSAKLAAIDFSLATMDMAKVVVNALVDIAKKFEDVDTIARKSNKFWVWLKTNWSADAAIQWKVMNAMDELAAEKQAKNPQPNKNQQVDNFFKEQSNKLKAIKDQIENEKINAEIDLYLNLMLGDPKQKALDELKPKLDGVGDAAKKAAEKMEGLNKAFNKDIKREEPKLSEKFLAENLTALQIYEKEIVRLNQMLAEGAQGELAFAMGSAAAIKKLKEATGLSSELKFAGAITKGSEADFKATLDGMGQNLDVQQQIRETLEAARKLQEQQLEAQKEIAAAIKAMPKPAKPVNMIGG